MAIAEFIWRPDQEPGFLIKPLVKTTRFGDGYEQRASATMNNLQERWEVTFTKNLAEIDAIRSFLEARSGVESFLWVNPHSIKGEYVAREWREKKIGTALVGLSATFEQVFETPKSTW